MSTTTTTTATYLSLPDATPATVAAIAPSQAAHEPTTGQSTPALHIRPYNAETDLPGIEALFNQVYHPMYAFKNLTRIAFFVFCRAYLSVSPECCFVLTPSPPSPVAYSPKILGYIVTTPNSAAFCAKFLAGAGNCRREIEDVPAAPLAEEMQEPALRGRMMHYFHQRKAWVAAVGCAARFEDVVFSSPQTKATLDGKFPAHFHLAVAPEVRRQGYGAKLVGMLEEKLRGLGVAGVCAMTPIKSDEARALYERCGFSVLEAQEAEDGEDGLDCRSAAGKMGMEAKVCFVKSL